MSAARPRRPHIIIACGEPKLFENMPAERLIGAGEFLMRRASETGKSPSAVMLRAMRACCCVYMLVGGRLRPEQRSARGSSDSIGRLQQLRERAGRLAENRERAHKERK